MLYLHLEHHHERVAMHKGRPIFASSKYTLALLGRGVLPKLDYDLLGHTPVTMILECYSHARSFHFYKNSAYLWKKRESTSGLEPLTYPLYE
jgi:hypothetical protein